MTDKFTGDELRERLEAYSYEHRSSNPNLVGDFKAAIQTLEEREVENRRLRTALETFANLENWWPEYDMANGDVVHAWDGHLFTDEPWKLAKDALEKESED